MKKSKTTGTVNIATLKAELAKYLRLVKGGKEVVVLDHKMPVARIVPYETATSVGLPMTKARGPFSEIAGIRVPPMENKGKWDSLTLLLEERGTR